MTAVEEPKFDAMKVIATRAVAGAVIAFLLVVMAYHQSGLDDH